MHPSWAKKEVPFFPLTLELLIKQKNGECYAEIKRVCMEKH